MYEIHTGNTHTTAEDVKYNSEKMDILNNHLQELIKADKLQGASYLLSRNGNVFAHSSMGKLSFQDENSDLMPDSLRNIASITKMFTAVLIMKLIENGRLYLEQPVSDILEEFNNQTHGKITIFHLLTHTSGLSADTGYHLEPYPVEISAELMNNKDWLKRCLTGPLQAPVGKVWAYCTIGYAILGEIIRRITGKTYEQNLKEMILTPLKMDSTFIQIPVKYHNRLCVVNKEDLEDCEPLEEETLYPMVSGGGIISSLSDMWKFGEMLRNGGIFEGQRILSRITTNQMVINQLDGITAREWGSDEAVKPMGMGVFLESRGIVPSGTFGHEGGGRCFLYVDKANAFTAISFIPSKHVWVPESQLNVMNIIWSGIE